MSKMKVEFAKRLRARREEMHLSQVFMAKIVDVSVITYAKIETGKQKCSLEMGLVLARIFNIDITTLPEQDPIHANKVLRAVEREQALLRGQKDRIEKRLSEIDSLGLFDKEGKK